MTLKNKFDNFSTFWMTFKGRIGEIQENKGIIYSSCKNIFHIFKNVPFWCDEDEAVDAFMGLLALICSEIQQKETIHREVYSKIEDYRKSLTRTRRQISTQEVGSKVSTSYDEAVVESTDLTMKNYGSHHDRDNMLQTTNKISSPEIVVDEGILTQIDEETYRRDPNWIESDDPAGMAKLINAFPSVEISLEKIIPRFWKLGIFQKIFLSSTSKISRSRGIGREWQDEDAILGGDEDGGGEEGGNNESPADRKDDETDDITEREYLELKKNNPDQVAENWQVERFTRRKRYIEKQIRRTGGSLREKWMMRLQDCEAFIEAFKKTHIMPPIGDPSEKLSIIASDDEWDKATFWSRINRTVSYKNVKKLFADYIETYNMDMEDGIEMPSRSFLFVGSSGTGKTHIAQALAEAMDMKYEEISLNGKQDPSVFFGVPQEYGGATNGEIIKAMVRFKSRKFIIVLDELDKCDRKVQQTVGNLTDKKLNKRFKDLFTDYPVPISDIIIISTINYLWAVEQFIQKRFTVIEIKDQTFAERMEVANDAVTFWFNRRKIDNLRGKVSNALIKKFLTWERGVRGLLDNVTRFAETVRSLNRKNQLPNDWDSYQEWPIIQVVELDAGDKDAPRDPCPVYKDRNAQHASNCECFRPDEIEGWVKEMGNTYP